jgi:hypothetical protein
MDNLFPDEYWVVKVAMRLVGSPQTAWWSYWFMRF